MLNLNLALVFFLARPSKPAVKSPRSPRNSPKRQPVLGGKMGCKVGVAKDDR